MFSYRFFIRTSCLAAIIISKSLIFAYGAGILPYSYFQNGEAYFLLGYENRRGWTDFGGKGDQKDLVPGNKLKSAANTATREFNEESLMMYSNSVVSNLTKKARIDNKLIKNSHYYMFAVNFENATDINGNTGLAQAADFRNKRKSLLNQHGGPIKGNKWLNRHGAEKKDFVYVKATELLKALNKIKKGKINPDGSVTVKAHSQTHNKINLWPVFVNLLKNNIDQAIKIVTDIINHN